MSRSNFIEQIKRATQESHVQEAYNNAFKQAFNLPIIERKHQCDGYFATEDNKISVLIEYKYDIQMKNSVQRSKAVAQCLGYLKKFEEHSERIPKLVFICDTNECLIIHTNDLLKYLDEDVDWAVSPCSMGDCNPNLILKLAQEVKPWVYDVNDEFSFSEIVSKIDAICNNTQSKLHITEKNIEKVYNLFCDRVIKDKKKIQANDLVSIFIGAMLDSENYYKHPRKKNILISNVKEVHIDGDAYDQFMSMHSTEYTPKEKRIMTAISDRLIEDTNRRNKGEFYTPTLFVDYAHKMIEKELGSHWKENYVVWDCCCGTKNLTRDYRFKELYCSTLEQAELDISKNYNKEATSFQFDFLNDSLDDLKVKAPRLLEAFELNKPICFFINPPYGKATGAGGNIDAGASESNIKNKMRQEGVEGSEFIKQFLWRITNIKRTYGLANCVLACFTKPSWLIKPQSIKFRELFLNNFEYKSGVMFNAGEFANVSAQWGITFNIWKSGTQEDMNSFTHIIIQSNSDCEIETLSTKTLINFDGKHVKTTADFISDNLTGKKRNKVILCNDDVNSTNYEIKESKVFNDYICVLYNAGNDVQTNKYTSLNNKFPKSGGGYLQVTKGNIVSASVVIAVRSIIENNWINDKDMYNMGVEIPNSFKNDALVFSIISNYCQSIREDKHTLKNEFFWMSKQEMMDLAEEYNNDYTYEDALNSEERFVYLKLQEIKDDLSPEAKAVLDKATELVKKSFKYRSLFNGDHPEFQINNWDCGWYQIKVLLKEFMPNELKEFRQLYKQLADKMRPMVYELGFLRA